MTSFLELNINKEDTNKIQKVEAILLSKANELGGSCEMYKEASNMYLCSVLNFDDLFQIDSGFNGYGVFRVSVESWGAPLFPPSNKAKNNGTYTPKGHIEMEVWLINAFTEFEEIRKYRSYIGTNIEIEL